MNWNLIFTILGVVTASTHICRFLFWVDEPKRNC